MLGVCFILKILKKNYQNKFSFNKSGKKLKTKSNFYQNSLRVISNQKIKDLFDLLFTDQDTEDKATPFFKEL